VVAAANQGTAKGLTGPQMMVYLREIFWLSATHNFRLTSQYIASKSNTLSDSLSRGDFDTFWATLSDWKLGRHQNLRTLTFRPSHIAVARSSPSEPATGLAALHQRMAEYVTAWIATFTQRNYNAYVRYYVSFCSEFSLRPLQPEELTVCLYVTRLAETCSYNTSKSYLTGVRMLHLEAGFANPLPSFFNLDRTLRGIKRLKGDTNPNRKLAVTPDILVRIIKRLDLFSSRNTAFVAAMLVAFFGFFRKANICPAKESSSPTEDLSPVRRCDFEFEPDLTLVWVNLRRTKTIQYGQRVLRVPLPAIPQARFYARLRLFSVYFLWLRHPPRHTLLLRGAPGNTINDVNPPLLCVSFQS
jgi:hypothetical protein